MIIEHEVFRLAAGVTVDEFLDADTRVQDEVAPFCAGFMRRTTARSLTDDGQWLIETLWATPEDAEAAARSDHAVVRALLDRVDESSRSVHRYATREWIV